MTKAKGAGVYQLKVTLNESRPAIWRRILVRGDASLETLHGILQIAMGWTNIHEHQFQIGDDMFAKRDPDDPDLKDESKAVLSKVAPKKGSFLYIYDFGDGWEHEIAVEKLLASDPRCPGLAACLEGERACPPEECGGIAGYANVLAAVTDASHPDHEEWTAKAGESFDPGFFDQGLISRLLSKLK